MKVSRVQLSCAKVSRAVIYTCGDLSCGNQYVQGIGPYDHHIYVMSPTLNLTLTPRPYSHPSKECIDHEWQDRLGRENPPPPLHELERYLDKDAMGEWGRLPQRFTAMFPAWALTFELISSMLPVVRRPVWHFLGEESSTRSKHIMFHAVSPNNFPGYPTSFGGNCICITIINTS